MTHRRCFTAVLLSTLFLGAAIAAAQESVIYAVDRASTSTFRDRGTSYAPTYLVYADRQRTPDDAKQLIADLGLAPHLDEYKARAFVVGPSNGTAYGPSDLTAFQNLLRTRRSSNLKVIGVGTGATFVNNVISKYAFAVAGILTYGGAADKGVVSSIPVPAYVHGADRAVAPLYVAANGATAKVDSTAFTTYTNPGPHAALQRVVVSKQSDANENLAQAFSECLEDRLQQELSALHDPDRVLQPGFRSE
jgi:hypothetical protein